MANPLGTFFSRLAPEDKRFVKRMGIFMTLLLVVCAAGLYAYSYYGKSKVSFRKQSKPAEITDLISEDTLAVVSDTIEFIAPPSSHDFLDFAIEAPTKVSINEVTNRFLENSKFAARLGHLLLEAGYPDDAIYVLQNGVPQNSAPISVLVDLIYGYFYSKRLEVALDELDSALSKYPSNADLLTVKAVIYAQHPDTSQRSKVEGMFKTILKKSPESAEANYQYGRYTMQRGDFKKSHEYLEKAVKIEPYNSRYIARLGMAEHYLRHDSNAEVLYKRALNINPYDYNAWFSLGELYLSQANESYDTRQVQQKIHLAMESYLKAIENDSLHADAHYRVGVIHNGNGAHKEAIKHLKITLEKIPRYIPSMQQLSSAYLQISDTAASVGYLKEILEIDPFNRIAANELKRLNK